METNDWYDDILVKLDAESRDYRQKAFLEAARKLLAEQEERITQLGGQLEGTIWSPNEWQF